MNKYNIGYISDKQLRSVVALALEAYRNKILERPEYAKVIDPIKQTIDSAILGTPNPLIVDVEYFLYAAKASEEILGLFHTTLLEKAGNGWNGGSNNYDLLNEDLLIFVDYRYPNDCGNKDSKTYISFQSAALEDKEATFYLASLSSSPSFDEVWELEEEEEHFSYPRIRRISIDRLYALVFGDDKAYQKIVDILPAVVKDVVEERPDLSAHHF